MVMASGWGLIDYIEGRHRIRRVALFVPQLGNNTLISISRHIQYDGCMFHAENNSAILAYPSHTTDLEMCPEMHSSVIPFGSLPDDMRVPSFDESVASFASRADFATSLVPTSVLDFIDASHATSFVRTALFHPLISDAVLPSCSSKSQLHINLPKSILLLPKKVSIVPLGFRVTLPPELHASFLSFLHPSVVVTMSESSSGVVLHINNNSSTQFSVTSLGEIVISDHKGPLSAITSVRNPSPKGARASGYHTRKRGFFHLDGSTFIYYSHQRHRARAKRVTLPRPALLNTHDDPATVPTRLYRPVQSPSPKPRPWDRVPSSTPAKVSFTPDKLLKCIGFLSSSKMQKALRTTSLDTINILDIDKNPTLDPGETASLKAAARNRSKLPLPDNVGDVWHIDIGFGPSRAVGGVFYALMAVDRKSRYKAVYPLANLRADVITQIRQFLIDVDGACKCIRTDFDMKLIGGQLKSLLTKKGIDIQAAPPRQQHKNGLVERSWQSVVKMARNWLSSAVLPSQFWWFAVKRATEVSNILPSFHLGDDKPTTPYEMFFGEKPDLRSLIPMFSVAWVHRPSSHKFESRSIKCIVVGRDSKSDGLIFYHPPTKTTFVDGNQHRFVPSDPAGPSFGIPYNGSFSFTSQASLDSILHRPAPFQENQRVFVPSTSDPSVLVPAVIIEEPVDPSKDHFVVQFSNGDISQIMSSLITDTNVSSPPNVDPIDPVSPHPGLPWIQHSAKVTFTHPSLGSKPKWGILRCDTSQPIENAWSFAVGKNGQGKCISLPNFCETASTLVSQNRLAEGWKNIRQIGIARRMRCLSNAVCRHISNHGFVTSVGAALARKVSAKTLDVRRSPTLLTHSQLTDNDRALWDAAYAEEFYGLQDLGTWQIITEDEYQRLRPIVGKALPSMAISTIKHDGDGNPDRCKYRIVVLGNLDPHNWSKSDCFAPVLSQMELRLLLAIAAAKKCIPKSGDVSQAFFQSSLPASEQYVVKPPPGCPFSRPKTYFKLLKTLYGLKRSPRHWYEKARQTLISMGLHPLTHSPCIFTGSIIEGEPPLYLGLYVDDFVYFSASTKVESKFETVFGSKIKTTFNGPVTHFLGITFATERRTDGSVSISLSQLPFVESLLQNHGLDSDAVNSTPSPFKSGLPIDSIPDINYPPEEQSRLTANFQHLVGCFQWLTVSTRPDLATVTNLLSKYLANPSRGHLEHCRHVLKYIKGTKSLGITFDSSTNSSLAAFIHSPVASNVVALADANWGAQDQSISRVDPIPNSLPLFKSRSLSGHLVWLCGPVHWVSKRQTITARSTAEAEIYATDECTKNILHIRHLLDDLHLLDTYAPAATVLHNDNAACVQWSHNLSTKGLRHIQLRENAVRESVQSGSIEVRHIAGAINLADLFTKEDKDVQHFLSLRDTIMSSR